MISDETRARDVSGFGFRVHNSQLETRNSKPLYERGTFRVPDSGFRVHSQLATRNSKPWYEGQVVVEYFILFTVVSLLTLIGFTTFHNDLKKSLVGFVDAAANKITN